MKRLIFAVAVLFTAIPVFAADFEIGIEDCKAAVFTDFKDVYGGGLVSVMEYKNLISFDGGYITKQGSRLVTAGVSFDIQTGCSIIGINYMLPEPVEVGFAYAHDFNTDSGVWAVYAGVSIPIGGIK